MRQLYDDDVGHGDHDGENDDGAGVGMFFCTDVDVLAVVVARQGQARPASPPGQPLSL